MSNKQLNVDSDNWEAEFERKYNDAEFQRPYICHGMITGIDDIELYKSYISQVIHSEVTKKIDSILQELNLREVDMEHDDFRTGFRYAMTYIEKLIMDGKNVE